jgi:hypothetical protein
MEDICEFCNSQPAIKGFKGRIVYDPHERFDDTAGTTGACDSCHWKVMIRMAEMTAEKVARYIAESGFQGYEDEDDM